MRLQIRGLQPNTDYAIQVRAVNATAKSAWSRIWHVHTMKKSGAPKAPTNFTFTYSASVWKASWDAPTQNLDGTTLNDLKNYELEISADTFIGTLTKIIKTINTAYTLTIDDIRDISQSNGPVAVSVTGRVRAVDTAGNKSPWSNSVTAGVAAPAAPTNAVVKEIMDGLEVSWDPSPSPDVTAYRVYVADHPNFDPEKGGPQMIYEGLGTSLTYSTSTYAMHYFIIRAVNAYNMESSDLTAQGTPKSPFGYDNTPPSTPTSLAVEVIRKGDTAEAHATWLFDAAVETNADVEGFVLKWERIVNQNPVDTIWDDLRFVAKEMRDVTVPLAYPYADYRFVVAAFDKYANYSPDSAPVTLSSSIPGPPTGVTVAYATSGVDSIHLEWTASSNDVTYGGYYVVDIDTANTFATPNKLTYQVGGKPSTPTDTSPNKLDVNGLLTNTTYYYRVKAIDSTGLESAFSTIGSIVTASFPLPPGPTDGFVPAQVGAVTTEAGLAQINVSWPAVTTRSDGQAQPAASPIVYEVHGSTAPGFTISSGTLVTNAGGTSAIVTKVSGNSVVFGTTYYFKVRAKDADGIGAPSTEVSGTSRKATGSEIESITAGQITTGSLTSSTITMGAGGVIKSNNYVAGTTGWRLDESGLDIRSGVISAGVLAAGTITATTIAIGANGLLRVDSTGAIQSNNYVANSTGWKMSSTGLEINNGSVSANLLKGGTIQAATIYVGSGGGIYDANGYWSITPTAISIQNGNISASTITSGALRSSQPALDSNGNAIAGEYAWNINMQGSATFGNAWVRGRLVIGTSSSYGNGVIQSAYYYPGSSGFRIDSAGWVEFNSATINAGLFKSQNNRYTSVEVGDTGLGDWVDEVRMFSNYTVSSIRNPSFYPGSLYFNFGAALHMKQMSDGWPVLGRGNDSGTKLKWISTGLQVRNYYDGGYDPIQASTFTPSSELKFKKNVKKAKVDSKKDILIKNGTYKWNWNWDNPPAISSEPEQEVYGLIADYLPDWMRAPDGYDLPAVVSFLWDSLTEAYERIEALEKKK